MELRMNWTGKYELSLREFLTLKDIMKLRDCGQPTATIIRNKAAEYCAENGIEIPSSRIPTEAVLAVTKRDISFYHDRMLKEKEIIDNKTEGKNNDSPKQ